MIVVDKFAGPGGWDKAARELGLDPLGIEVDAAAIATRKAEGLRTLEADVSSLEPRDFGPVDLSIASPPCPPFSNGGKGLGIEDLPLVWKAARAIAAGEAWAGLEWRDPRSELVLEPLRWALALEPRLLAWEQVPPVLPFWEYCAEVLRARGWRVWTGILEAERYGVPQTRERAVLMAIRGGRHPAPPPPTHQRYIKGEPPRHDVTLEGEILPWVSMADALDWHPDDLVGFPRRAEGNEEGEYRDRDLRRASEPAFAMTEKVRSWSRFEAHPWVFERPATTVQGDPRIAEPGWRGRPEDYDDAGVYHGTHQGTNAVRVTLEEAAKLQTFPGDFSFAGTRTKQFQQVGNAVPPRLAHAILEALLGDA